jgi:2-polyprenyl-3-methyl-5-hydroxy-6-metoxy-1,4-benzoquinol methylase
MLESLYVLKKEGYFQYTRAEMAVYIPTFAKRILDVGCGQGAFSRLIKSRRSCEIWGVEPMQEAARIASLHLDQIRYGYFTPELKLPDRYFDVVVFNDVLEHMLQPDAALQLATCLLADGGLVVASIPNFLYGPCLREIIFTRDWVYRDEGILDYTHVRFFTKKSILRMFRQNDFSIERCDGINRYHGSRLFRIANLFMFRQLEEFRWMQIVVVAHPNARAFSPIDRL